MNNDPVVPNDLPPVAGDGPHCSQHPYRPNLGGGICASCLKEKLGKLISASSGSSSSSSFAFPLHLHRPPSSSSSATSSPPSSDLSSSSKPTNLVYDRNHAGQSKIPSFLYFKKKKKNRKCHSPAPAASDRAAELAFRRSNTAPKRSEHLGGFLDGDIIEYSPRKKGFWSFLYVSAGNHPSTSVSRKHHGAPNNIAPVSSSATSAVITGRRAERMMPSTDEVSKRCAEVILEDDDVDCVACGGSSLERKVSRSRSVGCGSRSFSGDFFERISTGFCDCTFRRIESQREPNGHGHSRHRVASADQDYCMKNRVRCSRIFGGFMMAASSSSSLSSSSYWTNTSSSKGHCHRGANGVLSVVPAGETLHGRSRSWGGWVFASPMRALSRRSSKDVKSSGKSCNAARNLNTIPSLLTVGG